ncbi:MAG: S8 family serine peptidase, partial [Marinoscillum sp.]
YGDKDPEISHISTIESIEPYSIDDAMGGKTFQELSKVVDEGLPLRIRLFQHFRHAQNISIQKELNSLDLLNVKPLHYTDGLSVLEVKVRDVNGIALLASFPGTHTISGFPEFGIARTASRVMQSLPSHLLPSPREDIKYPLVGIIDSGTDPLNKSLQKWIQDRWDVVPRELQDNDHGSFVAGMICGGRILNHNDVRFPSAVSKIVDVVAFGNEGTVNEQDLIRITREAVIKYPMVDVWNLSFAITDHFCKDEEFSLFGCVLAELAHKYGKTFVVSAGNRLDTPSPGWPRETLSNDQDRICAPADSPTCLVVGSLAHSDNASTCVKSEEPSSFSRRGPGSAYLMAPHLMHYGGNCKEDLTYTQT